MNDRIQNYDGLDKSIAIWNMSLTGSVLATVHQPLDYFEFNYHEMCRAIGTCYPGSNKLKLNPEAFSFSAGTMTPSNIDKLLKRIKIDLNWDVFGRDREMRTILESTETRRTATRTKEFLDSMVRLRNRIAHTGAAVAEIDLAILSKQLDFIRAFSKILAVQATTAVESYSL